MTRRYRPVNRATPLRGGVVVAGIVNLVPALAMAQADSVMAAMQDELYRTMETLQIEEMQKPYFVSYSIDDVSVTEVAASFGAVLSSREQRQRWLRVEVRVGSYDLDNTNFRSMTFGESGVMPMFGGRTRLPLEDDYHGIRRTLWLATDAVYKRAVEDLSRKKAVLENTTRDEEIPDFTMEERIDVSAIDTTASRVDRPWAEGLVRDLSAVFRSAPNISTSRVELRVENTSSYHINSEGSRFRRSSPRADLVVQAASEASDGRPLGDFVTFHARHPADLPSRAKIEVSIHELVARIATARDAPSIERYIGPVLFEGQAAAELVAQILAPAWIAARRAVVESPVPSPFGTQPSTPFEERIGGRVLARFLHVVDDPTLSRYDGEDLLGGYPVDDDAVLARPTLLIQRGILKTLLVGRSPVPGVVRSSGNRRGDRILPSNVVFEVDDGSSDEELKRELLALVAERDAEFGILVRRMSNPILTLDPWMHVFGARGAGPRAPGLIETYKVYADGREEPVRNVELSSVHIGVFRDIVAASSHLSVYTAPFAADAGEGRVPLRIFLGASTPTNAPVVSWVVPSLLFDELTLRKARGDVQKPPIAPHPYFQ